MLKSNVYYLWLNAGTTPKPQPVQTYWQGQYGVRAGQSEMTFPHELGTASVVPAFTPSWNTTVYPVEITEDYVRARFSVPPPSKHATVDYSLNRGTPVAINTGTTSYSVVHSLNDISAVMLFSANWNTSIRISAKTANQTTVNFGVPAPAGAFVYYGLHADLSDITSIETVASGAPTHTVFHSADRAFLPIFVQPHWNTTVTWQTKSDLNSTVLKFGAPPFGTQSMDVRIKGIGNFTSGIGAGVQVFGSGLFGSGAYGAGSYGY